MSGVLHVCLTNLSRSPMAEAIMRAQLREALPVDHLTVAVSSAGLAAHPGAPLDLRTGTELTRRGLALEGFGAQPVSRSMMAAADLVLTATRGQRDELAAMLPAALFRTFTWRELASLLHGVEPEQVPGATAAERLRALAEIATRRRRILTPPPGEQLDVPQSWGRNPLRYRKLARQIEDSLAVVVRLMVPPEGAVVTAESAFLPGMRTAPEAQPLLSDLILGDQAAVEQVLGADTFSLDVTPPAGIPRPSVPVVVELPPDEVIELPDTGSESDSDSDSFSGSGGDEPAVRPSAPGWPATGGVRPVSGISPELAAETAKAIEAVLTRARGQRSAD